VENTKFWWKLIFFGGNFFGGNYYFWWKLFFGGKVQSMNSKKGTTSDLKDLQIQCSIGLDPYNAVNHCKQVSRFTLSCR
jgi:hypothetical protein